MANIGSTDPRNGNQQVTIYPQQPLSSVYGNEVLYNVIQEGPEKASVRITTSGSDLIFYIEAGSTLFFLRQELDPLDAVKVVNFIGKVSLTTDADYTISIPTFKSLYNGLTATDPLYLIADWVYDENTRYSSFRLVSSLTGLSFEGVNHQILLAKILNIPAVIASGSPSTLDVNLFHVSYEIQKNREVLSRLYNTANQFMVSFEADGSGVKLFKGKSFSGNSFISSENSTQWNTDSTTVISPPLGLILYNNNVTTGSVIDITGSEGDYYQVDFLRFGYKETTDHSLSFFWDSFLVFQQPPLIPTFTEDNIINYLSQQRPFNLTGNAYNVLVLVRERDTLNTTTVTKNFWPENCVIFKNKLPNNTPSNNHHRLKIPVYKFSDLE